MSGQAETKDVDAKATAPTIDQLRDIIIGLRAGRTSSAEEIATIQECLDRAARAEKIVDSFVNGLHQLPDPRSQGGIRKALDAAGNLAMEFGGAAAAKPFVAAAEALDELNRGNVPAVLAAKTPPRSEGERPTEGQGRRRIKVTAAEAAERLYDIDAQVWPIGVARKEVAIWLNKAGMTKTKSGRHTNSEIIDNDIENWGRNNKYSDLRVWRNTVRELLYRCDDANDVRSVVEKIVRETGNPKK